MSVNLQRKAKWLLPILVPGLLASAVLGGWKYWSLGGDGDSPAPVQVQQQQAAQQKPMPVTEKPADIANAVPTPISAADPTPADKAKPTGAKHEREENLLAVMAMRLHSEAYDRFINQKGLGMSRMVPMLTVVKREWKKPDWTSEELAKGHGQVKESKDLSLIHMSNVNFFLDSNTKTQEERNKSPLVDGKQDRKEQMWEIKAIDLIGLVVHDTPTVYISEKLPNMKDLAHRPTREMDVFEMEGLEELMTGKDLYVRGKDETIRVLGPVRAGKACLKCHSDAKEGDMLGAFSYTLRVGQYQMFGRGLQPSVQPKNSPIFNNPQRGEPIP